MNKTLVIIDGNSIINRAFYALPEMSNKEGLKTNAIYGFTNMLLKIIDTYNPTHISVAFDRKAPTFRHIEFKEYKAGRKKMPNELGQQLQPLKELLDTFNIHRMEMAGFEADDLIGTVAKKAENDDFKVYIVTGDKDAIQLASNKTTTLITKKGVGEVEEYNYDSVVERYEMTPTQFIDLKGLMGDKSDNIPGVPGIGEKTGIKLIKEFSSIENLIEKGFFNKSTELNEKEILECIERYKEIDSDFKVPSLDKIKAAMENSEQILLKSGELGIKCTSIFNDNFPDKLKNIKDKSILIFYKGNLNCLYEDKSIAIIGTRTPTERGKKIGEALGEYYAKEGFIVVSGLASGCDTYGHRGCLNIKGQTIATLPCGLDKYYPPENCDLGDEIVENEGCLISEYKIGTNPSKIRFIQRDRLQAALSLGVVVVECAIECGTMHTVKFAQKYNKKLAVSLHDEVNLDIETIKGNLYLLENSDAIGLSNIEDYKKYKDILINNISI